MSDKQIEMELFKKLDKISKEIAKGNDVYITKSASGVVIKKMTVGRVWFMQGFEFELKEFCKYCPNFVAETEQTTIFPRPNSPNYVRTENKVTCKRMELCSELYERLKEIDKENNK